MRIHRDAQVRTLQHLGAVSGHQQQMPAGSHGLAAPNSPSSAVHPHSQCLTPCLAPLLPHRGCRSILHRSASYFPSPEASGCVRAPHDAPAHTLSCCHATCWFKSQKIQGNSKLKQTPQAFTRKRKQQRTDRPLPAELQRAGLSWATSTASSGKPSASRTRASPAAGHHHSSASTTHA